MSKNKENSIFRVMVARIRHSTHDQLVELAKSDTEISGRQIYVADIVRDAIKFYLRNRCANQNVLDGKDRGNVNQLSSSYKN
jgi:hypothetical protein